LIFRKILKIVANKCHNFEAKMHKIPFLLGLRSRPRWRSYTALPQTPWLDLTRPGGRKGRKDRGQAVEGEGRRGTYFEGEREGKGGKLLPGAEGDRRPRP